MKVDLVEPHSYLGTNFSLRGLGPNSCARLEPLNQLLGLLFFTIRLVSCKKNYNGMGHIQRLLTHTLGGTGRVWRAGHTIY